MEPPPLSRMDQVTAVDWPGLVPVTVAENERAPLTVVDAEAGETVTEMFAGGAETVTVACPDFDGSATLVATMWKVPVFAGAVEWPAASTVPPPRSRTDQLTAVDWPGDVPVTVAEN